MQLKECSRALVNLALLTLFSLAMGISAAPPPPATFRFAKSQGDKMVLQAAPAQATVWGFSAAGADVIVSFNGQKIQASSGTWLGENTWIAKLPPTKASMQTYNITASSGKESVALADVLFGEVWVCSGQSNMQYPLGTLDCWNASNVNCTVRDKQCGYGCVENAGEEISHMADYPYIRLLEDGGRSSDVPVADARNGGWHSPTKRDGVFSAMCWFFGRNLYAALNKHAPTPVGLIETNVGGTPDQHWSSPDALSKCKHLNEPWEWPDNFTDSVLWNGKVVPYLRNTIKGAVWMQGEANSRTDGRQYNCSFPAMITDWRSKWTEGTGGTTDPEFPFGWAQLNSNGRATVWSENSSEPNRPGVQDPLGIWNSGFTGIRLAEDSTLALPNTFQAVILDTPVASGSIHSPYKQVPGDRLTRGALAVAYDQPQPYPVVSKSTVKGDMVVVTLDGVGSGVELRGKDGFEVFAYPNWHTVPVSSSTDDSVSVGPIPANATAMRYLWRTAPCGNFPYKCAVYAKVSPLGTLSGQMDVLPLGPFVTKL